MQHDTTELPEEAVPLIADDLKSARTGLGITSARAAKLAGISWSRYRALETGQVRKSNRSVAKMVEVARSLGLESVRISYVDIIDQYARVSVAKDEPPTIFFDALDSPITELKARGHFISPHLVLDFLDREGITPVLDSRKQIDKMMVELWVTAIYALSFSDDHEYYVRPISDDPPDTEVLSVDRRSNGTNVRKVEVTQYGRHSAELTEVIAKKLRKRYEEGTVLLVLVEETQKIPAAELYRFIQERNPYRQEIVLIGGAGEVGEFRVMPWVGQVKPAPGEVAGVEITTDMRENKKARCRFDGAVVEPPFMRRFRPNIPVFVKSVELHR